MKIENNQLYQGYIEEVLKDILETASPTGFHNNVMEKIQAYAEELGFSYTRTNKGNGIIEIDGESDETIAFCAHVDTLGLMVRAIKSDGTLAITTIGGPIMSTLDGEYCKIITREGNTYTGTILSNSPAAHVFDDSKSLERIEKNMHIRLDEVVKTKEDVLALGIGVGNFICIETKTEITPSGFIKSRFLDDKLSVAIMFGVLKYLVNHKIKPKKRTLFLISTYEEVGHGMSYIPNEITELIAVDMGCIGDDLSCTEYDVSICAKDSSGPYDYDLTNKLINLAKENALNYAVDIYPYYGSDASSAVRGGNDVRIALIGAGVAASHGMERSHFDGVFSCINLILLYME